MSANSFLSAKTRFLWYSVKWFQHTKLKVVMFTYKTSQESGLNRKKVHLQFLAWRLYDSQNFTVVVNHVVSTFSAQFLGHLEQNGVAERMNLTVHESFHSILRHSNLLNSLWGVAIATATHTCNHSQTSATGNSGNRSSTTNWCICGQRP